VKALGSEYSFMGEGGWVLVCLAPLLKKDSSEGEKVDGNARMGIY
jgi:hypothetical protein